MQEGRTNLLEKPAGDLKILIRFTGKADNHIDSEKNAGNLRPDRPIRSANRAVLYRRRINARIRSHPLCNGT